jgi:hypothetical protein
VVAAREILARAEICVTSVTWRESTMTPSPKLTKVLPGRKSVPLIVTLVDFPRIPFDGTIEQTRGNGQSTLNPSTSVAVPPPGGPMMKDTSRVPLGAEEEIDRRALILESLSTVNESTWMLLPRLNDGNPPERFVPDRMTMKDSPRTPTFGEIAVSVGTGLSTVNARGRAEDPPPGPEFVTITSRLPACASGEIVIVAVVVVDDITSVPTEISSPIDRAVAPLTKPSP